MMCCKNCWPQLRMCLCQHRRLFLPSTKQHSGSNFQCATNTTFSTNSKLYPLLNFHIKKRQIPIWALLQTSSPKKTNNNNRQQQFNFWDHSHLRKFPMGLLDLEKHFAFYGAYHSNPVNVLIHILFVWPILFTALVLFYFTPPLFSAPQIGFFPPVLVFNFGFLFAVVYALFYAALDIKAGSLAALLTLLCWVGASFVASSLGFALAWKVVLAAQLFCWIGQFIGHGVFEKRAPALLDNLVQAFLMAPFFVLLEVLQSSFGYEPYPGFQTRVKARIEDDIKQWQDKKRKKFS